MAKWVLVAFVLALIGLFPLSIRVADPLFSRPYEARFEVPVLLVFPDHVEVRLVRSLSEVTPPQTEARYTFAIPPSQTGVGRATNPNSASATARINLEIAREPVGQ